MRKLIITFALILGLCNSISAQWDGTSAPWTQGSGTQSNPYLIENAQHLAYLSDMVNAGISNYQNTYFRQTVDINLNNHFWTPIGDGTHPFKGHYDGSNHKLEGLLFDSVTYQYIGLFGCVQNGSIKNLNCNVVVTRIRAITSINIRYIGALCGFMNGGSIINCTQTGKIADTIYNNDSDLGSLQFHVGGIVGYMSGNVNISKCTHLGQIIFCNTSTVRYEHSSTHEGQLHIAGIVGNSIGNGSISHCCNKGTIFLNGNFWARFTSNYTAYYPNQSRFVVVGGVVNCSNVANAQISVSYCYNTGTITGQLFWTGTYTWHQQTPDYMYTHNRYYYLYIAGIGEGNMLCSNCYNAGTIVADNVSYRYGVAMDNTLTNCYYLNNCGASIGGTPRTESQMRSVSFPIMLNADSLVYMVDNMNSNRGYPVFVWSTIYDLFTDSATTVQSNSAILHGHFSGNADSVGFFYHVGGSDDSNVVILSSPLSPASHWLTNLTPNTIYYYRFFDDLPQHQCTEQQHRVGYGFWWRHLRLW